MKRIWQGLNDLQVGLAAIVIQRRALLQLAAFVGNWTGMQSSVAVSSASCCLLSSESFFTFLSNQISAWAWLRRLTTKTLHVLEKQNYRRLLSVSDAHFTCFQLRGGGVVWMRDVRELRGDQTSFQSSNLRRIKRKLSLIKTTNVPRREQIKSCVRLGLCNIFVNAEHVKFALNILYNWPKFIWYQ